MSEGTDALQPGTQLDGRYEVVRLLGQGGMAAVYQVRHLGLQSTHALKVLNADLARDTELRGRFLSEGRIQAMLRHPNIVQVTEIVTTPVAGLVMDYVEGPTLGQHIQNTGALSMDAALEIFLPVLDAVEEAHKAQVVHRDLKPDNIILGRDSRGRVQPKVTDFGIAKLLRDEAAGSRQRTRAGARMGTLLYMSPEQVREAGEVDARSDIFSLGAILYEAVTGKVAFDARSDFDTMNNIVRGDFVPPERIVGGLPPVLAGCIRKALAVEPAERFQDCAVFRSALESVRNPLAEAPPRPSRSYAVTQAGQETSPRVEERAWVVEAPKPAAPPPPPPPPARPKPREELKAEKLVRDWAEEARGSEPLTSSLPRPPAPLMAPAAPASPSSQAIKPDPTTSPVVSLLLSLFLISGLGQIYNQQIAKGLVLIVVSVVLALPTFGCSFLLLNLLAGVDAYCIASKRKKGKSVEPWEFF